MPLAMCRKAEIREDFGAFLAKVGVSVGTKILNTILKTNFKLPDLPCV